jgi:iron complex transport system substrate-binding protein
MKLFKLFLSLTMTALLVSCSSPKTSTFASASATAQPSTVTITDHADREVEVPTNPKRVAVLGIYPLPSMLTVYLDSCDSIVAMEPGSMNAAKNGILSQLYPNITNITTDIMDGDDVNIESLLALKPDVVFYNASDTQDLEKLENAGLTAVAFSATKWKFNCTETFNEWMNLLDQIYPEHAGNREELIKKYSTDTYNRIQDTVKNVEEKQKVLFLFQYDENAMITSSSKFFGQWWCDAVGAVNVAQDVPAEKTNAVITMEQVYEWDPDVIVITNFTQAKPDDLYNNAIGSDDWSNVSAVKNKRVYKMPLGTYRTYTPSVDSPMTLEWLAQAVYPELFKDMDVKADVKEYYQNLFGVTLTDEQVDQMYTPNASASSMN